MNSQTLSKIDNYIRQELKLLLDQCTSEQKRMFKLMYARDIGKRSVEDAEKMNTDEVIDKMPKDKIDDSAMRNNYSIK